MNCKPLSSPLISMVFPLCRNCSLLNIPHVFFSQKESHVNLSFNLKQQKYVGILFTSLLFFCLTSFFFLLFLLSYFWTNVYSLCLSGRDTGLCFCLVCFILMCIWDTIHRIIFTWSLILGLFNSCMQKLKSQARRYTWKNVCTMIALLNGGMLDLRQTSTGLLRPGLKLIFKSAMCNSS